MRTRRGKSVRTKGRGEDITRRYARGAAFTREFVGTKIVRDAIERRKRFANERIEQVFERHLTFLFAFSWVI